MKTFLKISLLFLGVIFLFILFFNPYGEKRHSVKPLAPPKHGNIYVVAHRGAHNDAPKKLIQFLDSQILIIIITGFR